MLGNNNEEVDLNLLRVFDALFRHQTLKGAAIELKVSPQTITTSLRKLTKQLQAPLFIRQKDGTLLATPFAISLQANIATNLAAISSSLHTSSAENRVVSIACSPYVASIVFPLIFQLQSTDRQPSFRHINLVDHAKSAEELLLSHEVDVVFDHAPLLHETLQNRKMLREKLALVCRTDHPRLNDTISVTEYEREQHVVLSEGTPEVMKMSSAVNTQFPDRKVVFCGPNYLALLAVVEVSDAVCLVPWLLLSNLQKSLKLKSLAFGFKLGIPEPYLYMSYRKSLADDILSGSLFELLKKIR